MLATNNTRPGCFVTLLRLLGLGARQEQEPIAEADVIEAQLPYRISDRFLSPAEASFYRVLATTTQGQFLICPKVTLGELFLVPAGAGSLGWRNRISSRSVDFLLCDPATLRPRLALELDDASHTRTDRQDRDAFIDRVFAAAGLPLLHIPVRASYDTRALQAEIAQAIQIQAPKYPEPADDPAVPPLCRKCGVPMMLQTARRGARAGTQFYGCPNFPDCRETRDLATT